MIGMKFSRLIVLAQVDNPKSRSISYECFCECGNRKVVTKYNLLNKMVKSCGCLHDEMTSKRFTTHGLSKSPTYTVWANMKSRCYRANHPQYNDYGGRGITVCESWINSFENFLSDIGEKPFGLSLDRIDNNKGYSKENCRWASLKVQNRNKRENNILTIGSESKCIAEWSEISNLSEDLIRQRVNLGWSAQDAISIPKMKRGHKYSQERSR